MSSYDEKWLNPRKLSGGGQGATHLVTPVGGGDEAVLKRLVDDTSAQARRRMFQEVTHLRALKSAGAKVPAVLDDNTSEYESSAELFFVMERIPGRLLSDEIAAGLLPLEEAVALVFDVAATVRIGLREGVLHRDLKPKNLMVRGRAPWDVVTLDYGLSFNHLAPTDNTRASERIENSFLILPELQTDGTRHSPVSDITALSALLLYCMTGKNVGLLVDGNGEVPQRRPHVKTLHADQRWRQMERFFDKAFTQVPVSRFQTLEDWEDRLRAVVAMMKEPKEDPAALASQLHAEILTIHRPARLAEFRRVVKRWIERFNQALPHVQGQFYLSTGSNDTNPFPQEVEYLGVSWMVQIAYREPHRICGVTYRFCADGEQIRVYRQTATMHGFTQPVLTGQVPVGWLAPEPEGNLDELLDDVSAQIASGMRAIKADFATA